MSYKQAENQKEYWDSVAYDKTFTTPFRLDLFSRYVAPTSPVLDIGCGYGRTLNELNKAGYRELHGIDFSEKMVERGKNLYPSINLAAARGDKVPFPDSHFPAVIILAVLTCIIDESEQKNLLLEIKRVLKPDGIVYINDFLLNSDERNIERYNLYYKKYRTYGVFELPEGAVVRHHSPGWIEELTKHSGFRKLIFEETEYVTMNGNRSKGFYYIGRKTV